MSEQTPANQPQQTPPSEPMPKGSLKIALISVFSILVITTLVILWLKSAQPQPPVVESKEKAWNVQTIELSAADRHPEIELLGTVESPYTSELRATVNADVTRVDVSEGQYVAQGQILLTLDDREKKQANLE